MEEEYLYQSIYEYLLARIYFGYYPKEKPLPSIHKLGNVFGVSTITVRSALRLLEQAGYISTRKNKRTEILPDPPGQPRAYPGELLLKEEIQMDLYRSFERIFPRLFYCGLSACSEQEVMELNQILKRPSCSWDEPTLRFMSHLVKGMNNSLALNLYYDVMLFSYPTYLAVIAREPGSWEQAYRKLYIRFGDMLRLKEAGDGNGLWSQIQETYSTFSCYSVSGMPDLHRSSSFCWRKPQICQSTAIRLVCHILLGTYPVGSFLPSARVLAEKSKTSVITMRRAIALLNDLGIAESINGRGTRILPPDQSLGRICWDKPSVRKSLMEYLESLHLLAVTCRGVAETVYPLVSPEVRANAMELVRRAQSEGRTDVLIHIYVNTLIACMELSALREIYSKLLNLLILGLPLAGLKPQLKPDCCVTRLAASLESPDPQQFAAVLEQLVESAFLLSRDKMLHVGILEAGRLSLGPGKG